MRKLALFFYLIAASGSRVLAITDVELLFKTVSSEYKLETTKGSLSANDKRRVSAIGSRWYAFWGKERLLSQLPSAEPSKAYGPFRIVYAEKVRQPVASEGDTEMLQVRRIEDYLANEAALALGRDVLVTSAYRTDSRAHERGAIDIQTSKDDGDQRIRDASAIAKVLKDPNILVLVEEVLSDGTQINTYFRGGKPYDVRRGKHEPNNQQSQFHARGDTCIHIQPEKSFRLPDPDNSGLAETEWPSDRNTVEVHYDDGELQLKPYYNVPIDIWSKAKLSYPWGWSYEGQTIDRLAHGAGVERESDGRSFEGFFRNGLRVGWGHMVDPDGTRHSVWYPDGNAVSVQTAYVNGDHFTGYFLGGKKEGYGTYTYANGDVYEGEFHNDLPDGVGKWSTQEATYEGDFRAGTATGHGTVRTMEGVKASGKFINGQLVNAMVDFPNGSRYMGDLKIGMFWGRGYHEIPNKWRYNGDFVAGRPDGQGELAEPNVLYRGEFSSGKANGKGQFFYTGNKDPHAKKSYVGEVRDGRPDGRGYMEFISEDGKGKDMLFGEFRKGVADGPGHLMYFQDGTGVSDGEFVQGELVAGSISGVKLNYAYKGTFKNWKPDGKGEMFFGKDSKHPEWGDRKYVGEFKDGKFDGYGEYVLGTGASVVGSWNANKFVGNLDKPYNTPTNYTGGGPIWGNDLQGGERYNGQDAGNPNDDVIVITELGTGTRQTAPGIGTITPGQGLGSATGQ